MVSSVALVCLLVLLEEDVDSGMVFCFFFFQAEDGIRDLVRSRGLGDVYKRQGRESASLYHRAKYLQLAVLGLGGVALLMWPGPVRWGPVSYTHLTLPTSDLV